MGKITRTWRTANPTGVRYARLVDQGVPEQELILMCDALQRGQLTGDQRLVDEVEQIIGCRIERPRPGRPLSRRRV